MSPAIAFLPWVQLDEAVTLGPLRLLPYRRGRLPGDLPNAAQSDIDAILDAYANRPRIKVEKATLLEMGEWQTGMDADDVASALFRAQHLLAFSALSHRRLFRSQFDYCNFDTYSLVIQRYATGTSGTFAFTTRRRDGGVNQIWSSEEFAFHRPYHVDSGSRVSLDYPLLSALIDDPNLNPAFEEAIREFNHANTDSPNVREHVEVVMGKSAFEWLLGINERADEFKRALLSRLDDIASVGELSGPLESKWREARPRSRRPLEAWASEFCDLRGASAHGTSRKPPHHVWSAHTHLAFVSMLFPLIFKKIAACSNLLELDNYDVARLARIDSYVLHDPFDFDWMAPDRTHPWAEIDIQAFVASRAGSFYPN